MSWILKLKIIIRIYDAKIFVSLYDLYFARYVPKTTKNTETNALLRHLSTLNEPHL